MPIVERTVTINAPIDKVDSLLTDPAHSKDIWNADSFEPSSNWPQVGSTATSISKLGPMNLSLKLAVVEHVPGQSHSQTMDGSMKGTMSWTLAPEGNDTRLKFIVDYNIPSGVLGQALDK